MQGLVFNIQRFSIHDGPGTRTTVFLKGCNLRCYWCHNPESIKAVPEIQFIPSRCIACGDCVLACPYAAEGQTARFTSRCTGCGACAGVCYAGALNLAGKTCDTGELASRILEDKDMMRLSGGGVTLSGGEPLLQADFAAALLSRLKEGGVHTAVETALNVPWKSIEKIRPYTDLFICDIKNAATEPHRRGTGAGNEQILENIRFLSDAGAAMLLRIPVIPGFNDTEEAIHEIGGVICSLPARHPVELLAFHNICAGKYDSLGREFPLRKTPPPSPETMKQLISILENLQLEVLWKPS
jgi:pyruvate formate lyase activating enzyme